MKAQRGGHRLEQSPGRRTGRAIGAPAIIASASRRRGSA
jgi:hypothetical protein